MKEEKKKVELNDKQLEMATGGSVIASGWEFYGWVGQYDGVINDYYYFVADSGSGSWIYGKLTRSYEKFVIFGTKRTHEVEVDSYGGPSSFSGTMSLPGSDWTMYKYRRKA